jgi:hypothetical protein
MTDTDDDSFAGWDEVVDVICVGTSLGVLAYAICCATADLDVLMVNPSAEPDDEAANWYAEMTADLVPSLNSEREYASQGHPRFSLATVVPLPERTGKRVVLETFVGEHLRQWSEHCLHSPFGVMFTQVPDLLVPISTDSGQSVTAAVLGAFGGGDLGEWLTERAREYGLSQPQNTLAATVFEEGRIAGVELHDGYRVAARSGLAWPVVGGSGVSESPIGQELTVAIVGRTGGRFAAVDLIR